MTTETTCFWSLLSCKNLDFLYISPSMGSKLAYNNKGTIKDLTLHHSLLDFIHPDEQAIAQQDLMTFIQRKTLAGAVTRCRLQSLILVGQPYPLEDENDSTIWNVVDMVMYTVTECIVLAFFHCKDCQMHSTCGEPHFTPEDTALVLSVLQANQPQQITPDRVLQIYDRSTKQRLVSWPPSDIYYTPDDDCSAPPPLKTPSLHRHHIPYGLSSGSISDANSRHSKQIIISYGCVIFYVFCADYRHSLTATNRMRGSTLPSTLYDRSLSHGITVPQINSNPFDPLLTIDSRPKELGHLQIQNNYHHQQQQQQQRFHHHHHHHHIQQQQQQQHSHHHQINTCSQQQHQKSIKVCVGCGTNHSPEWRRGPTGHKTLCNACGLRYSRHLSKQQRQHKPTKR
ncbi:hypothetical protein BC941DRAFT_434926 [Chlamydoabsidia padenii]|nr:hypothetical protein BC941DRAFT_434926 [Chlamydoabsidia padenii]